MNTIPSDLTTGVRSTRPDRHRLIAGSDARIIMGVAEAALIPLLKARRDQIENPPSKFAISELGRKTAKRSSSPESPSSQLGDLSALQAFSFFPQSGRAQADVNPASVFRDKDQSSCLHRRPQPLDHAQPRVSTSLKPIDRDSHTCCKRELAGAPAENSTTRATLNRDHV